MPWHCLHYHLHLSSLHLHEIVEGLILFLLQFVCVFVCVSDQPTIRLQLLDMPCRRASLE